jgi:hypothetical protein
MKDMTSLSGIIGNIYSTALEVSNQVKQDGLLDIKNLSIELSVVIEQKRTYTREIDTKVRNKSTSFSDGITKNDGTFSSQIRINFIPKNDISNQY